MSVQRPTASLCHPPPPPPSTSGTEAFIDILEGVTCRNSTVSSDSHLQIGH